MRGFKIFLIMTLSAIIVISGSSVAYYNTRRFGFDEDTVLFSADDESVTYLDYTIHFDDVNNYFNKIKRYFPEEAYIF